MPTAAMTALATITLSGSQATVTFSSIVGTYRDLRLVVQCTTSSLSNVAIKINTDAGANYALVEAQGNGSSGTSTGSTGLSNLRPGADTYATSSTFFTGSFDIMDYSATDKHKTVLMRVGNTSYATTMAAGRWANTAAVTGVQFFSPGGANFTAGSTFTLYGVSA